MSSSSDPMAFPNDDHSTGRRNAERTPGAWAAAAVVLAVGALIFGVMADRRASDLAERVAQLERAESSDGDDTGSSIATQGTVASGASSTTTADDPLRAGRVPADEAAAKSDVQRLVRSVFGAARGAESLVDDPTGVDVAMAAFAASGGPGRPAFSEIRFTSSTGGYAEFRLSHSSGQSLANQRVGVVAIGPVWMLQRSSVCAVFEALDSPCGD